MRTTIKFILHSALVVAFIALATAAFTPMAKAKHSPTTSGTWLVLIDWDEYGRPSIKLDPMRFDTPGPCSSMGQSMVDYLEAYEPDRLYVSVCAQPDDVNDLDAVIDMVIADFRKYFQSGQGA